MNSPETGPLCLRSLIFFLLTFSSTDNEIMAVLPFESAGL